MSIKETVDGGKLVTITKESHTRLLAAEKATKEALNAVESSYILVQSLVCRSRYLGFDTEEDDNYTDWLKALVACGVMKAEALEAYDGTCPCPSADDDEELLSEA